MLAKPVKSNICKTCNLRDKHSGRTQCIICITEKARAKQKTIKAKIKKGKAVTKKRFSRPKLIDEADRVFSLYIRHRDKGKPCVTCGAPWTDTAQCGHFMSRRHLITRWNEQNAHGQCVRCNCWGAGEQYAHAQAIEKMYGAGVATELQLMCSFTAKASDSYIIKEIQKFYTLLDESGVEYSPKKYFLESV